MSSTSEAGAALAPEAAAKIPAFAGGGQLAQMNYERRTELLGQIEVEGGWKPAMIVNLLPIEAVIENGLIPYRIPACPAGKDFAFHKIATGRTFAQYRASHSTGQDVVYRDYDIKKLTPLEMAFEYQLEYTERSASDLGGVFVFEGDESAFENPNAMVEIPYVEMRGRLRLMRKRAVKLKDLMRETQEKLKFEVLKRLQEAQNYSVDPQQRKNITPLHQVLDQYAFSKRWTSKLHDFTSATNANTTLCDGCSNEYRSKTGVCQCGHVQEVLKAYMGSHIKFDHVRMDSLSEEDMDTAVVEKKRRDDIKKKQKAAN